jgi:hypothetical protein
MQEKLENELFLSLYFGRKKKDVNQLWSTWVVEFQNWRRWKLNASRKNADDELFHEFMN